MKQNSLFKFILSLTIFLLPSILLAGTPAELNLPWWGWPTILFFTTFLIGVFGVMAGIGGGVLFVPLATSFFSVSY